MATPRDREIDANYAYFQTIVPTLIADHEDEYALLRHQQVVGLYRTPGAAVAEAGRFDDGLFSIQRVIDRPLDLGLLSYAADERATA